MTGEADDKRIEPLLLIPIVENSFKHGINAQMENSFVNIRLDVVDGALTLSVENSVPQSGSILKEKGGIGLDNVKKRLELIYPDKHFLQIQSFKDRYKVDLQLNLS